MKYKIKKSYLNEPSIYYRNVDNPYFRVSFFKQVDKNKVSKEKIFSIKKYGSVDLAFLAAKQYRNKVEMDFKAGLVLKQDNLSVNEMYMKRKEIIPKSISTERKLDIMFKKYIAPFFDNKIFIKINAEQLQLSLNSMIHTSSDDTIRRVLSIWRDLYRVAIMIDIATFDLTLKLIVPKSKYVYNKRPVEIDEDNIIKIINSLENGVYTSNKDRFNNIIYSHVIKMIYYTGLRPSEAYALTKSDINISKKIVWVGKRVGSTSLDRKTIIPAKTKESERKVPIPDAYLNDLINLLEYQKSEYLFANYSGELLDTNDVSCILTKRAKKLGFKFNLYMLRHKMSTDLLEDDSISDRTAMEILGHKNYSMTVSYARSNDQLKEKAI